MQEDAMKLKRKEFIFHANAYAGGGETVHHTEIVANLESKSSLTYP